MNLKQKLSMLGVLFVSTFSLLGLQPASAAVNTCVNAHSATTFPSGAWTKICNAPGSTTVTVADGNTMRVSVNSMRGASVSELKRANNGNLVVSGKPLNGVQFWLFATPEDYRQSAAFLGLALEDTSDTTTFSVMRKDANNIPIYVAVFKTNDQGRTFSTAVEHGTVTGAAKAIDYLQGFVNNGGIQTPVNYRLSDTDNGSFDYQAIFELQIKRDYDVLNSKTACGSGGIFRSRADSTYPTLNFICDGTNGNGNNLTGSYVGKTNQQILSLAWPKIYPAYPGAVGSAPSGTYQKFFAEAYTKAVGGADTVTVGRTADAYFNVGFACTNWFIANIPNQNKLMNTNLPAGCVDPLNPQPNVQRRAVCLKLFNGAGHFPDGNVFNCTLDANNSDPSNPATAQGVLAANLQTNLQNLGKSLDPSANYGKVKVKLDAARSNIFVFVDKVKQKAAFSYAGVPTARLDEIREDAYTGPVGTMWYTFTWSADTPYKSSYIPLTSVINHELGHTLDLTSGQPSSGGSFISNYFKALQWDFINLDYVVTPTTHVQRLPCNTVDGPLVGAINPFTGQNYCVNGLPVGAFAGNKEGTNPLRPWKTTEILLATYDPETFFRTYTPLRLGADPGVNTNTAFIEWYAQAFSIAAKPDTIGVAPVTPVRERNKVAQNGYFKCTTAPFNKSSGLLITTPPVSGYAGSIYAGETVPTLPPGCTSDLPDWWEEIDVQPSPEP